MSKRLKEGTAWLVSTALCYGVKWSNFQVGTEQAVVEWNEMHKQTEQDGEVTGTKSGSVTKTIQGRNVVEHIRNIIGLPCVLGL